MFADLCQKFARDSCGNSSGSGQQARRWQCETLRATALLCVLRKAWDPPLGGRCARHLRRPYWPLQVIGVLAAVLPIARKSVQFSRSAECAGKLLPIPAQINLARSGERLHANTAPILWAALSASQCSTQLARDSYRTNSSCCNQPSQRLEEIDGFFVRSELESIGGEHEFSDTPRRRHRPHIDLRAALGARAHSTSCGNLHFDLGHAPLQRLKTARQNSNPNSAATAPCWPSSISLPLILTTSRSRRPKAPRQSGHS